MLCSGDTSGSRLIAPWGAGDQSWGSHMQCTHPDLWVLPGPSVSLELLPLQLLFFFFHSGPHPATELRDYSWLCARGSICSARDGSRVDCIKGKNLASTTNSLAPFYSFQVFKIYFGFWDYTGGGGWGLGVKPHSTEVALGNVQETLGYKGQTQVSCMKSMCPLTGWF